MFASVTKKGVKFSPESRETGTEYQVIYDRHLSITCSSGISKSSDVTKIEKAWTKFHKSILVAAAKKMKAKVADFHESSRRAAWIHKSSTVKKSCCINWTNVIGPSCTLKKCNLGYMVTADRSAIDGTVNGRQISIGDNTTIKSSRVVDSVDDNENIVNQ